MGGVISVLRIFSKRAFPVLIMLSESRDLCYQVAPASELNLSMKLSRAEIPGVPVGRSMLVRELPVSSRLEDVQRMFESFGAIERIIHPAPESKSFDSMENRPFSILRQHSSSSAVVVFDRLESLRRIFQRKKLLPLTHETVYSKKGQSSISRSKFDARQAVVDEVALEEEINSFLKAFEEGESSRQTESGEAQVDDEGWTMVTRGPTSNKKKVSALKRKAESSSEHGMYKFKRVGEADKSKEALLAKFQEDRARIARSKATRKFKP